MDSLFEAIEEKLRTNGIIDRLSCSVRAEVLQVLKHPESRSQNTQQVRGFKKSRNSSKRIVN